MTAETAAVLPLLVAVTLAMVWLVSLGVAQVGVTDAAREAARAVARGDSEEEATSLAQRVAPGARVVITVDGELVLVSVNRSVRAVGALPTRIGIGSVDVHAEAVALQEGEPP